MNCLRCHKPMAVIKNKKMDIEICNTGCGSLWFDTYEFRQHDEAHEVEASFFEALAKSLRNPVDCSASLECPQCDNMKMMQHSFHPKSSVMIDECPACAGVWLDGGELEKIHQEFTSERAQRLAFDQFFQDRFGHHFRKKAQ